MSDPTFPALRTVFTYAISGGLVLDSPCPKKSIYDSVTELIWKNLKFAYLVKVEEYLSDEALTTSYTKVEPAAPLLFFHFITETNLRFLAGSIENIASSITLHLLENNSLSTLYCRNYFVVGKSRHFIIDMDFLKADIRPLLQMLKG